MDKTSIARLKEAENGKREMLNKIRELSNQKESKLLSVFVEYAKM